MINVDTDVVHTICLRSLFVVIPKAQYKEFQSSYEKLCQFVVPRSIKLVLEDDTTGMYMLLYCDDQVCSVSSSCTSALRTSSISAENDDGL